MNTLRRVIAVILPVLLFTACLNAEEKSEKATFAGGCFWCIEPAFKGQKGIVDVISGYTGGSKANPTYEEVCSGATGHFEAVQVAYDPSKINYTQILDIFWKQIDPTDAGGQFVDRGSQYKTAIFYHSDEQKKLAEESKDALDKSAIYDKPIVTAIIKASDFYKAEEYHQNYSKTCPVKYKLYRVASGRDQYLKKIWQNKKTQKESIRKKLTPMQYKVTQQCGTEPPFANEYWNNKKEGIYVDVVSGEPLFSSLDKFDSGTGWPSFTKPLEPGAVTEKEDTSLFMKRTEVKSKDSDSHLGHVFSDGPAPAGLRYCINSASLKFIPKEDLEKEGYGKYKKLFEQ